MQLAATERANALSWMSSGFNIYGAYDILQSSLQTKIFDPAKAPGAGGDTPFGKLPAYLEWRPQPVSDFFYASGENRESFASKFAARASVDVSVGAFSGHVEAAFDRSVSESSSYSYANVSYFATLGNLTQVKYDEAYLSDGFRAALAALPGKVDPSTLDAFSDFFREYGAYFISQVTLGATLEYYVAVSQSSSITIEHISAKAQAEYKALFWSGKASAEMSSDKEWQSYNSHKRSGMRIKGGGLFESGQLSGVSLGEFSPETKAKYDRWLATAEKEPAVMDFRLKGIWEVCGAKRRIVEDAFREYGKMMRPLLHVETGSYRITPDRLLTPRIYLGGRQIAAPSPSAPYQGWGGYQMLVIDRRRPTLEGVRLNKIYNFAAGDAGAYRALYDSMLKDLLPLKSSDNFLVLCSYGFLDAFPPTPDMLGQLKESGAGRMLTSWINATPGIGTSSIKGAVNYILVGIMHSGPDAGAELYTNDKIPASVGGPVRNATLEISFYSLGPGKPYVLGAAERTG